jgi:uncharacterized protein (UPF0335 family)
MMTEGKIEMPPEVETSGTAVGELAELDVNELGPDIAQAFERIRDLEAERSAINADIQSEKAAITSRGLNGVALRHMYQLWKMEPDKKTQYGKTVEIVDTATQMGLFEERPTPKGKATMKRVK